MKIFSVSQISLACCGALLLGCESHNKPQKPNTDSAATQTAVTAAITDTLAPAQQTPPKNDECIKTVMQIVQTSPHYVEKTQGLEDSVIKNGGTSLMIVVEASPNPGRDNSLETSEDYEFSLRENYPDRTPVIARYTFKPTVPQLYEYDVVSDSLRALSFDTTLLDKFRKNCQ
jgi:hypothetical protein